MHDKGRGTTEHRRDSQRTTIILKGAGISVQREITEAQAAAVLEVILRPGPAGATPARLAGVAGGQGSASGREAIGELFRRIGPKRNPDRIVTIAAHLKAQGRELVTHEDIRAKFREAGEVPPANYARDFRWTRANGWMAEDPATGMLYVTASGLKAVDRGFTDDVTKGTRLRRGVSRRKQASGGDADGQ